MHSHVKSNGESILISSMGDQHLIDTIKVLAERIVKCRHVLSGATNNDSIDVLLDGLSDVELRERAANIIRSTHSYLGLYALEASIRGIDTSNITSICFGRSSKTNNVALLGRPTKDTYLD